MRQPTPTLRDGAYLVNAAALLGSLALALGVLLGLSTLP